MTDNRKSDPRKVHVGPTKPIREDRDNEVDNNKVVQLPTEVIDRAVEPTWIFERIKTDQQPKKNKVGKVDKVAKVDKVKAAVKKCQTALISSKVKADVEKGSTDRGVERHTLSADILRHREIREKCFTIREVALTGLTIFICINVVIFMIWFQMLLFSWRHT